MIIATRVYFGVQAWVMFLKVENRSAIFVFMIQVRIRRITKMASKTKSLMT